MQMWFYRSNGLAISGVDRDVSLETYPSSCVRRFATYTEQHQPIIWHSLQHDLAEEQKVSIDIPRCFLSLIVSNISILQRRRVVIGRDGYRVGVRTVG